MGDKFLTSLDNCSEEIKESINSFPDGMELSEVVDFAIENPDSINEIVEHLASSNVAVCKAIQSIVCGKNFFKE